MESSYSDIASSIRTDILSGKFRPGELLPSVESLMRRFDSGEYAVRHALSSLANDGALVIKPHVGARVTGSHLAKRKGRVVFVTVGRKNNFHDATFAERIGERIRQGGREFTDVVIEAVEEKDRDISALEREISYGVDLAIVNCRSQRVVDMLESRLVPYVLTRGIDSLRMREAIMTFCASPSSDSKFTAELVSSMRSQNVRTVLEVDYMRTHEHVVTRAIHDAGFTVQRTWGESDKWRLCGAREVERLGMELVSNWFADNRHRAKPPDLIVFMDDYLARGGLLALTATGLRAPEDIKIVSQTNKNCEPVYFRRLTRFETDPEKNAKITAEWALAWLSGRKPKRTMHFEGVKSVRGETL